MDKLVDLSNATLGDLDIARPTYDRSALTPGIVHIGVGNFHRAHQAWYLHRLMQNGQAHDWAILGAGVRPYDAAMREKLLAQDCLTTLIELDPAQTSAGVNDRSRKNRVMSGRALQALAGRCARPRWGARLARERPFRYRAAQTGRKP